MSTRNVTAGTGCGCLLLAILTIFIVFRALWKLLPVLVLLYLAVMVWQYLTRGEKPLNYRDHSSQNKDSQIITDTSYHRSIKQAEVVEEDETDGQS